MRRYMSVCEEKGEAKEEEEKAKEVMEKEKDIMEEEEGTYLEDMMYVRL